MSSKFDISIIVSAYNAEDTIDRCLSSILSQRTEQRYNVIVVNDGSTDRTMDHLQTFNNDPRIRIINKSNTGASDSRNVALRQVDSTFVTFVDSDDYVDPDYLKTLSDQYENNPNLGLAISGYQKEEQNGKFIMKAQGMSGPLTQEEALKSIFASYGFEGYLVNKLFVVSVIEDNKLRFNTELSIAEDLYFCCQYIRNVEKIYYNPEPTYHYVMYDNSQLNSISIGKEFSDKSLDLLRTLIVMKKSINVPYISFYSAINARICWAATVALRTIYAAPNKSRIHRTTKDGLWKVAKCYYPYFKNNDLLPKRDLFIYWINRFMPNILGKVWNIIK